MCAFAKYPRLACRFQGLEMHYPLLLGRKHQRREGKKHTEVLPTTLERIYFLCFPPFPLTMCLFLKSWKSKIDRFRGSALLCALSSPPLPLSNCSQAATCSKSPASAPAFSSPHSTGLHRATGQAELCSCPQDGFEAMSCHCLFICTKAQGMATDHE